MFPPRGLGATGSPELTGPGRGLVGKSCCPSGWWAGFVNRGFGPWAGLPTQPRGAPHGVTQGAAPHPYLGCGVPEELWRARQAFPSGTCRGPEGDSLWANLVVPFGACGGTQCPLVLAALRSCRRVAQFPTQIIGFHRFKLSACRAFVRRRYDGHAEERC